MFVIMSLHSERLIITVPGDITGRRLRDGHESTYRAAERTNTVCGAV
jgi:hypothetical protein